MQLRMWEKYSISSFSMGNRCLRLTKDLFLIWNDPTACYLRLKCEHASNHATVRKELGHLVLVVAE